MMNKEALKLEFTKEDSFINLEVSENFNTDDTLFDELAFYLGGLEYHHQKDSATIHLTTLEKLEILCKKAREYADEESEESVKYEQVKVLVSNDKYYLDSSLALANAYDSIELIQNNTLKVSLDNKFGAIDLLGKEIIPIKFDDLYMLANDLIYASDNEVISLYTLDKAKEFHDLEDVVENDVFSYQQSYFWLRKNNKWGLFDHKLNQIIPFRLEYDYCELLSDNVKEHIYIKVFKDGKCGLINGLLNINLIKLEKDIEDILVNHRKNFLVKKHSAPDLELDKLDIDMSSNKLKDLN